MIAEIIDNNYWVYIIGAYLIGSIPFGIVVAKILNHDDPRNSGSGNIGATNMLRLHGKKAGIITLILDFLKGLLPVLTLKFMDFEPLLISLVGFALVFGHMFPIYLKFKGGKGVATGFGVMIVLAPIASFYGTCAFLVFTLITRWVALGSIIAALSIPFFVIIQPWAREYFFLALAIGLFVVGKHHANILRLIKGTEPKI